MQADWADADSRIVQTSTYDDPKVMDEGKTTSGYYTLMKDHGKLVAGRLPLQARIARIEEPGRCLPPREASLLFAVAEVLALFAAKVGAPGVSDAVAISRLVVPGANAPRAWRFRRLPFIYVLVVGFTDWNAFAADPTRQFADVENYRRLVFDTQFLKSLWLTLQFSFWAVLSEVVLGCFLAQPAPAE